LKVEKEIVGGKGGELKYERWKWGGGGGGGGGGG